jgi:hypothetical protein
MYLYDTFTGLDENYSEEVERNVIGNAYDNIENWHENVVERFSRFSRVKVIKGVVPEVLLEETPAQIAFLHLDLNAAAAEATALEVLFDRISVGGIVLMDDYGRSENFVLHMSLSKWMNDHGHTVLEMLTGQEMVIKRR